MASRTSKRGLERKRAKKTDKVAIGERARRLRIDLGLSAVHVARLVKRHPSWLSHIEHGRRGMTLDSAERLALALGVSLGELLEGSGGGGNE